MAPIRMKTKTSGPISPGTSSTGKSRDVRAISKELDKAIQRRESLNKTREDYFGGRKDITDDRLEKRQKQADLVNQFKKDFLNPIKEVNQGPEGFGRFTRNLGANAPMSFEKFRQETANKYGPTNREVMGDIGFGLGNIAQGFGDFAARGGTIGNVLSDLFSRVKGGTTQGIDSVKGLYDNLRKNILREPTVTTGGGSTIYTTTEDPFQDLTREKIQTQAIDPLIPPRQIGDESDPSIFGLDNAGVSLPEYYDPNNTLGNIYLESIGVVPEGTIGSDLRTELSPQERTILDKYLFEKMLKEEQMKNKQKEDFYNQPPETNPIGQPVLMAENTGLPSLMDLYNFSKNPQIKAPIGNLTFDNVFSGKPELGYSNSVDVFGQPVDLNARLGQGGLNFGASMNFKKGGSVDKYAGLGYKFK